VFVETRNEVDQADKRCLELGVTIHFPPGRIAISRGTGRCSSWIPTGSASRLLIGRAQRRRYHLRAEWFGSLPLRDEGQRRPALAGSIGAADPEGQRAPVPRCHRCQRAAGAGCGRGRAHRRSSIPVHGRPEHSVRAQPTEPFESRCFRHSQSSAVICRTGMFDWLLAASGSPPLYALRPILSRGTRPVRRCHRRFAMVLPNTMEGITEA
jgi:hypothetical protein